MGLVFEIGLNLISNRQIGIDALSRGYCLCIFWIMDYFLKYSILNETQQKINTIFRRKGCVIIKIETFSINPLLEKWCLHMTKFKFGLKGTKMMLGTSWVDLAQKNFWVAWRCRMKLFYTILSVTLVAWSMLVRKT